MFCGLGEEERTTIRKKKRKKGKKKEKKRGKKEINLIAAKSGLVGMKGYLKTYNHMKFIKFHKISMETKFIKFQNNCYHLA